MYILTSANANSNKFWEVEIDDAGQVKSRNGRVGTKGQSRVLGQGEALFNRKIREKEKKGYRKVDIVGTPAAANSGVSGSALVMAAEEQIGKGDPVVTELVRDLARINRHQILSASGGKMDLDLTTGIISTPVGVVTAQNLDQARKILEGFEKFVKKEDFDNPRFITPLEEYLMLVPQKVGHKRGWHREFITDMDTLTQQGALLDQLESSIDIAESRVRDAAKAEKEGLKEKPEAVFDVSMTISEDPKLRRRIEKFYNQSRSTRHVSHRLKPARIFEVSLGDMARNYEEDGAKVGGVMELWHGTRAHNLLSILKNGLIIPKGGGSINVTGRMFGNGIYFSDQSTKSLNYAYGYWDGGSRDNRCYMFLSDVAMGKAHHPTKTGPSVKPPAGYDSVYARGGKDIVMNNEMIVYRTSQANLKYLVEFE
ncbi:MAG: WGR domain-containing protein [Roseibium sp.]|uniref:WGR domain-containing protein n=1 Tax=Roseibium sp. TaxID=1936156 RepID=UPI00329A2599